ncbi:von Willebrand factor type A domain-containing protein [Dendryphion nanum]|uniref:von Willebrand factor type A domain-containing protein n=1 Tax=Dendryphion nanum TaxID=256645 RepID=A0A9P9E5J3_9PLEO|nr:von Willebrand factor type A domain-containing protein [Dendryphion nanum]
MNYIGRPRDALHSHQHVSGLYFCTPHTLAKTYLPQVELQSHSTILSTAARTVLTQTFLNRSETSGIKEARYTFPLYDGVSVVGFTCRIGDRTIVGEVKEREKARTVFNEAVAQGQSAGLLEQLPDAADVFTTTIGNIPPCARVVIKITYLGELKHDMEVDGIRFTIPNVISPRYGKYPGSLMESAAVDAIDGTISITVDAEMAEGSFIQQIISPSHPIAVSMGTTTFAPNAEPSLMKASASLSLGTAQLHTDFVLQIVAKDTGIPKAVLESHPTIPNHRALMATLVPKFSLPADKPEVVFVCDRSGSMAGSGIKLASQALKVFLKSLPIGVKFNICSFGSTFSFLWPRSVTYSQQTLDEATRHVSAFDANYGGTDMLPAMKATVVQRYNDLPLEIMLLTDGEIWDQQQLFNYLNEEITEKKAPIRVFTLGVGSGVSTSLIEGVARAGDGFAQTVADGEKMDTKVVRMLKGALSPHIKNYTLEVKYIDDIEVSAGDEDFEIVEKVADSLKVNLDLSDKKSEEVQPQKPISLFNPDINLDEETPPAYDETGQSRYAHLPEIAAPNIIQAPHNIPSLFAFNRTTVYLLLGPEAPKQTPKSVVLRGSSTHGPLELEIPIQVLPAPGEFIHQLAAKKAIAELEQGRGWLPEAKDAATGDLLKTKFEGRFGDLVEREAVRLGVQFQVGGKWCSFVAVDKENNEKWKGKEWLDLSREIDGDDEEIDTNLKDMHDAVKSFQKRGFALGGQLDSQNEIIRRITGVSPSISAAAYSGARTHTFGAPQPPSFQIASSQQQQQQAQLFAVANNSAPTIPMFSAAPPRKSSSPFSQYSHDSFLKNSHDMGVSLKEGSGLSPGGRPIGFSNTASRSAGIIDFDAPRASPAPKISASGFRQSKRSTTSQKSFGLASTAGSDGIEGFGSVGGLKSTGGFGSARLFGSTAEVGSGSTFSQNPFQSNQPPKSKTDDELLDAIVALQTFEGYWEWTQELFTVISLSQQEAAKLFGGHQNLRDEQKRNVATALAVAFLEKRLAAFSGSWELVVEKGRDLLGQYADAAVEKAKSLL